MSSRSIDRMWSRVEELRSQKRELEARTKSAREAAARTCTAELRDIRSEGVADITAARGKAKRRELAGRRRCRVRRSAISGEASQQRRTLTQEERAARQQAEAAEREAGLRAMPAPRRRSEPITRQGKKLSASDIEQAITEARSVLESTAGDRDGGNAAAALWFFDRATLRKMLGGLRPREELFERAVEKYGENIEEINAAYADHVDKTQPRDERRHVRQLTREHKSRALRTSPILEGAPMQADATGRVTRALEAIGHTPEFAGGGSGAHVRCEVCGGRGRLRRSSRGACVLEADSRLRRPCRSHEPLPAQDDESESEVPF